jgi:hypothetical protein
LWRDLDGAWKSKRGLAYTLGDESREKPKREACVMVRLTPDARDALELAAAESRQPAAKFVANLVIDWLLRREAIGGRP